ncbi:GyrI-like domain-containing protein [Pseudomonadota bacterium]
MKYTKQTKPIKIVGIKMRTDNNKAFEEIPPHWQRFFSEGISDKILNKISKDIYGVYTDFENEGKNNEGIYSFIVGMEVEDFDNIPDGLDAVIIPESTYQVFSVGNKPEQVGKKWQEIWEYDFEKPKTFLLEFEKYYEDGNIDIFIGVKS